MISQKMISQKMIKTVLILITIGCLVGSYIIGGIITMFGGSVFEEADLFYYLWFAVPALLWVIYFYAIKKETK